MTFTELVESVSKMTGVPKKDVKKVIYQATSQIDSWVRVDKIRVKIPGFGRFDPRKSRAGKAFGRDLVPRDTLKFTPY